MMLYLAIVLVIDFAVGFMLGIKVPPIAWLPARSRNESVYFKTETHTEQQLEHEELSESKIDAVVGCEIVNQNLIETDKRSHGPVETPSTAVPIDTWDEFTNQFKEKAERVRYSQQLNDTALGSRAHAEFEIFIQAWYRKFQNCMDGSSEIARLKNFEPMALELLVAQIETSLTNFETLPWNESCEDAFEILVREINLLDEQLKKVIKSTKAYKSKARS